MTPAMPAIPGGWPMNVWSASIRPRRIRLLPKMLNDPSSELRRDAVAAKLDARRQDRFASTPAGNEFFKDLLQHARDRDQVNGICAELKKAQVDIDQTAHYGFVTNWLLVGPFDNSKGVGFNIVYPPEKGVDLKATYPGKSGQVQLAGTHHHARPSAWSISTTLSASFKATIVYGYAAVSSEMERPVEIRAGSNNAMRIWVNGKEIYFREEYHHGMEMDQHVGKTTLKAGRNEILIKVCQNEQTESWAEQWSFQLRVCDALGAAVPVVNVTEKTK